MTTLIKSNSQVTVTDITSEARETLSNMVGYDKEVYEKKAFERERRWYWSDLGHSEQEVAELVKMDLEFAYD